MTRFYRPLVNALHKYFMNPICTKTTSVTVLLLSIAGMVAAQQEGTDPPAENNIICFAAKKQWVCAPADEQEKAREKASRLALEPEKPDLIDTSVEIQPLQSTRIDQTAMETRLEHAVRDFVARDELAGTSQAENNTTATDAMAEQQEPEPTNTTTESVGVESQTATNQPADIPGFQTAPTDFAYWKANFAEQWTFQVVGTSNRHQLTGFIEQNDLHNHNYTIVKTQRAGADWWVVLTGLYQSRTQAKSQQHSLPEALADTAWVRQIKTIEGTSE